MQTLTQPEIQTLNPSQIYNSHHPTPIHSTNTHLTQIAHNWSLDPQTIHLAIPAALIPHPFPAHWSPKLIEALRDLSDLTINQKERAHSLLETYFRARMRCGLDKAQKSSIFAVLEVVDVKDAIRSLGRINLGKAVEGGGTASANASPRGNRKRKLSGKEESGGDGEDEGRPGKVQRATISRKNWEQSCLDDNIFDSTQHQSETHTPFHPLPFELSCLSRKQSEQGASIIAKRNSFSRAQSLPSISVHDPGTIPPPDHARSESLQCSPLSALLNTPPTPGADCTELNYLPPITTLLQELEALPSSPPSATTASFSPIISNSHEIATGRLDESLRQSGGCKLEVGLLEPVIETEDIGWDDWVSF